MRHADDDVLIYVCLCVVRVKERERACNVVETGGERRSGRRAWRGAESVACVVEAW